MVLHKTNRAALVTALLALGTFPVANPARAADPEASLSLHIPAQSLEAALLEVCRQAHMQLVIATGSLPHKPSVPLTGSMSLATALDLLLKDKGLTYKIVGQKTIAIVTAVSNAHGDLPAPPAADRGNSSNSEGDAARHANGNNSTSGDQKMKRGGFMGRLAAFLGLCVTAAASNPACAQNAAGDTAAQGSESTGLEEIVVTAQRRVETSQRAALAITALSSNMLDEAGVTNTARLNDVVPNVKIGSVGFGDSVEIFVRGIGSTNNTEVGDPAVSFNLDGVYMARPRAAASTFFDVARVEVLRGPQGTLYGRNATAGSINVITNKPTHDFEGTGTLEYGNFDLIRSAGVINLPFTETVMLRAAFQSERHNGYTHNTADDVASPARADYNDEDSIAGRVHLLIKPNDALSLLLTGDYGHSGGVGGLAGPIGTTHTGDPYTFAVSSSGSLDHTNNGLTATLDWVLGPATLTYVGSLRTDDLHTYAGTVDTTANANNTPPCIAALGEPGATSGCNHNINVSRDRSTSHELRLAGDTAGLKWVGGVYYFRETNDVYLGIFPQSTLGFIQPEVLEDSKAGFGQVTWSMADTWRLTGGVRYTKDHKSRTGGIYVLGTEDGEQYLCNRPGGLNAPLAAGGCLLTANQANFSWNHTDWKGGLEHDLTDRSLLYLNVGTGYKAGGFGPGTPPNNYAYGPENLRSYEIGSKNRFLNDHLQANLTAFYYDYRDFQVSGFTEVNGHPASTTVNAQKAELYGLESENIWQIGGNDRLSLDLAYLHARYTQFQLLADTYYPLAAGGLACATPGAVYPNCANYAGNTLANAPEFTGTLGFRHVWPLANGAGLSALAQTHYESSQNLDYHNFAVTRQGAFTRSDFSLAYSAPDDRWQLTAYVRNIEDKAVLVTAAPNTSAAKLATDGRLSGVGTYAPPRTFGVWATAKF